MRVLARAWWTVTAAVTGAGLFLAFAELPVSAWLAVAVLGAGAATWCGWAAASPVAGVRPSRLLGWAAGGAAVSVALAGLAGFVPLLALLHLVLVGGAALLAVPASARARMQRALRERTAVQDPVRVDPAREADVVQDALRLVVHQWTDAQLCRAWRTSVAQVRGADGPSTVEAVVRRQLLLDEMERRDPAGFASWLDAQPHASSPRRFLHRRDDPDAA